MRKRAFAITAFATAVSAFPAGFVLAQNTVSNFIPVTQAMLENPAPEDWLMFSRSYDAQRFSPLGQIDRSNVKDLRMAWSRGMGQGTVESIPLVHDGIMYVLAPGAEILALDATTGDKLWSYQRPLPPPLRNSSRSKNLAIYQDMIYHTAADGFVIALDARSGSLRWQTEVSGGGAHIAGLIVVNGVVISSRACGDDRASCFIAGHDALSGKELWRFQTIPALGEPGSESWGISPAHERMRAAAWGLPGSYDPARNTVFWGIANPSPYNRQDRHGGDYRNTSLSTPADLYSNSTVALDPQTGALKWYYQHLPGDDWDEDYTNERTLLSTTIDPDPQAVKWINEAARGQQRDVSVMIGEGGGIFVIDRNDGEFLWASPFPFDTPEFLISRVDADGIVHINEDALIKEPGGRNFVCFFNTRSYWPTAYSPRTHSLYTSWYDACLDYQSEKGDEPRNRQQVFRDGADREKFAGMAKIDLESGRILYFNAGRHPSIGATLATAGGLIFNGDINRRFRAFDDETGATLWETIVGGTISNSTISYAVNGRQYIAILTGDNLILGQMAGLSGSALVRGDNSIYVFALPEQ
ncbi:MAG: PQQ-binding-like beta-propeller repeat protein [Pseudomonadales bacterium]|nr:PQQ-binding-like beta-propeller repeat protein [Pseudomonadales bacterium]